MNAIKWLYSWKIDYEIRFTFITYCGVPLFLNVEIVRLRIVQESSQ